MSVAAVDRGSPGASPTRPSGDWRRRTGLEPRTSPPPPSRPCSSRRDRTAQLRCQVRGRLQRRTRHGRAATTRRATSCRVRPAGGPDGPSRRLLQRGRPATPRPRPPSGGSPVAAAQAVDPVEDRRMGRDQARRARLELLDRVREVHVLGRPVGDLEDLRVARRSWRAPARGRSGLRVSSTDDASARYSRWRLTASWTNRAMIGARIGQHDGDDEDDRLQPAAAAVAVAATAGRRPRT